ncbi:MAG: hypothetical protein OT477_02940 [Chloroflexi bacterium]|nr:hypothetical protein [Chloroflexota bacterium]
MFPHALRRAPHPYDDGGWGNVVGVGRPTQYVRGTHKIRFGRPTPMPQRPTPWRLPCYGWVARANAICFPHVLCRAPHPYDDAGGATSFTINHSQFTIHNSPHAPHPYDDFCTRNLTHAKQPHGTPPP